MASGADTHTHTHAYIRTEVISINQARAWFNKPVTSQALVDIIVITLDLGLRPQSCVITMIK